MLSTLPYCKDNQGSHYTVGNVRSNVSIEINGELEPGAQPMRESFSRRRLRRLRLPQNQARASLVTF